MVITSKVTVLISMYLLPLSCISESVPALHTTEFSRIVSFLLWSCLHNYVPQIGN